MHQSEFDSFVEWYNNALFSLDSDHTVGINTIYRDCEPDKRGGTAMTVFV